MRKATRRLGRLSGFIAAGVAIVATGSGVMAASYSTFNASTESPANQWRSGTLALTDDDSSSAMFTADQTQLTGSKCIKVSTTGSYSGAVRLYSTAYSSPTVTVAGSPTTLGEHINLKIEIGTAGGAGAFADCSTFSGSTLFDNKLSLFTSTYTNYSTGKAAGWSSAAGSTDYRVFKFSWSYDDTAPQNTTATDTFTWEAQTS